MRRLVQELLGLADAESMRRALLAELVKVTATTIGMSHRLVIDARGQLRVVDVAVHGPLEARAQLEQLEGSSYRDLGVTPSGMLLDPVAFGRFSVIERDRISPQTHTRIWEPLDVHSSFEMNLVHDGVFLSRVSLLRVEGDAPATSSELVSLRSWPKVIVQIHIAAIARAEAPAEGEAVFVVDHDHQPSFSGGQSRHWQHGPLRQAVLRLIASLDDQDEGSEPEDGYVDGTLLHAQRLRGVEREDGFLVQVIPVTPWRVPPVLELPPVSRRVAAMAARGATAGDIAESLGRSQDTIRTHLRRAYETLGISSRTELTHIIGALGGSPKYESNRA
ncbi:MAG: LuxR C-terminal-related transcriptional regulator [Myxococcota bacterium]